MRFSLPQPLRWSRTCDEWRIRVGLPEDAGVRVYQGVSQALYEVLVGTAHFFNHKKSVAFIQGNSWLTLQQAGHFYKETYKVQIGRMDMETDWNAWVASLATDTVAVVWAMDNPITGERFQFSAVVEELLNQKKIYSIQIQHCGADIGGEVHPYTVRIFDYGDEFAWILHGKRFRTPPLFVQHQAQGSLPNWAPALRPSLEELRHRESEIAAATQSLWAPLQPHISNEHRSVDRLVFQSPLIHAGLLRDELLSRMRSKDASNLNPNSDQISSPNLCVTEGFNQYSDWWQPAPSRELLRGMLVVDSSLGMRADFKNTLIESINACQTSFEPES